MGKAGILLAALLLMACGGGSSGDRDVHVKAAFVSNTTGGSQTSAGGAAVGVKVKGLSVFSGWHIGEPFENDGPIPPTDLPAQGEALLALGVEQHLIDGVATPAGTVALVRDADGTVSVRLLGDESGPSEPLPANAHRLLLDGIDPLTVRVLLEDGVAIRVSRAR